MTQTHDLGNFFWHTVRVKRFTPPLTRASTQEVESPYRRAVSWVFHVPGIEFGIVFGLWSPTRYYEDEALIAALRIGLDRQAPELDFKELDYEDVPDDQSENQAEQIPGESGESTKPGTYRVV